MKKEQYKELFSYLNTTQRAFALKHEIPVSTLSDIVNGRIKSLPKEIIEKLHEEYGIRYEWLVT
ncbi:MAG: helix-turn-helix transcriptional regulator, partial [Leptospiraceae bacterium]|nr:helix-turn-helix transcriptional regulator [Leptospiraceae bacterium]